MTTSSSPSHLKMMQQGTPCKIKVIGSDQKEKIGEVRIQFFTKKSRVFRALKILGIVWGIAFLTLFVPILHFILVPLLFLSGILASIFVYQTESLILGGEGTCPNCESFLPIVRTSNKWPFTDLCSHCRTTVTIIKDENSL